MRIPFPHGPVPQTPGLFLSSCFAADRLEPGPAEGPGSDPSLERQPCGYPGAPGGNGFQEHNYLAPSRRDRDNVIPVPQGQPGSALPRGAPNRGGEAPDGGGSGGLSPGLGSALGPGPQAPG